MIDQPSQQQDEAKRAVEALPPEDRAVAERIATGVRAVLASDSGDKVIAVAKEGVEQLATSAASVVLLLTDRLGLSADEIPVAALSAVLEIFGFLVQKGLAKQDSDALRTAVAMTLVKLIDKIGPPDQEDIEAMNQVISGLGDEVASLLGIERQTQDLLQLPRQGMIREV